MIVINAVQSVLSIVLMISIGYFLAYKKWFNDDIPKLFSKLLINVSIPALMISNLMGTFDKDKLINSGIGLIVPFSAIGISYGVSMLFSKILKLDSKRRGVFQALFAFSNVVFVGLPVNVALFGESSAAYVLLYYFANTSLFWTIGVYGVRRGCGDINESMLTWDTIKKIFSPPLIAFMIVIIFIMMDIKLPLFIMDTSKYIGNLSTPLSMIYLGIIIHSIGFKGLKFDKTMIVLMTGRFIITPLLVFVFLQFIPVPELMKKVFIILSAMPVMTQIAIIAQIYNSDHEYATVMVTATTTASLIFIPFYMYLISIF